MELEPLSNFLDQKPNSVLILLSPEKYEEDAMQDLFFNTRLFRITPDYQIHLSCQGSRNETGINFWNPFASAFVKRVSVQEIETKCLEGLRSKVFKASMIGIVPYNIRGPGFRGGYGDIYRLLSEKFGFQLNFYVERSGFGIFNKTTKKWNGMVGKVCLYLSKAMVCFHCICDMFPDSDR